MLKYAKELAKQLMRSGVLRSELVGAIALPDAFDMAPRPIPYAATSCIVVVSDDVESSRAEEIAETAERVAAHAPLSKFGVEPRIAWMRSSTIDVSLANHPQLHVYVGGRTWRRSLSLKNGAIAPWLSAQDQTGVPPVLSTLDVAVELEDH